MAASEPRPVSGPDGDNPITDEQIRAMAAESRKGRQNAHKRAVRVDAEAALKGSRCAREMLAARLNKEDEVTITLDRDLVAAIKRYLSADWKDGRDPSGYGALNAVAYIGERLATAYNARMSKESR